MNCLAKALRKPKKGTWRLRKMARPIEYYSKLPESDPVDVALIIDPMLATGGSATPSGRERPSVTEVEGF